MAPNGDGELSLKVSRLNEAMPVLLRRLIAKSTGSASLRGSGSRSRIRAKTSEDRIRASHLDLMRTQPPNEV